MDWFSLAMLLRPLLLVLMLVIFVGIFAWAYWPSRKSAFEDQGRIPFREDGL
jgi:cbb3-type cytochrome oxidase subunit 3